MANIILQQAELVKRISNAYINHSFQPLTLKNMEIHLEDLNILADRDIDFNMLTSGTLVEQIEYMAERFDELGYETSYLIMNAVRFLFKTNETSELNFTVKNWLEITRIIVGTINTTLRYRKDVAA